ncbi:hypothetical protein EDD18DRAFT_1365896 [Armillaria luteobubalina]|uniref:Heterokaryon incompatibility domain-containing protein n=1 Tax=Armillaria luteobubalina TaxID=153913 RepID=A0AA39P3L0_9AGAR|nr:hypothetical protein EDD18DRAFT_1365896 [Armillaria luteobubalina]
MFTKIERSTSFASHTITVWMPINSYEWPVPIPKDADLNLIRIKMLNLGLEYTWLDVLCLRQVDGRREDLRIEEWKLDVPTIGRVYQAAEEYFNLSVCYLSGLGRPLTLKEGDLESDRSWFRRAWTQQEAAWEMEIAGGTPDGPLHAECKDGKYETELLTKFHEARQYAGSGVDEPSGQDRGTGIYGVFPWIPAYYESASLEDAWTALVHSMFGQPRAELFMSCPEPGDRGPKWRLSWNQVMTKPLLPYETDVPVAQYVDRDETVDEDWCDAECIDGFVRGLAVVEGGDIDRDGEFIVECDNGIKRFEITAAHTYPIPESTYTLIYCVCCAFPAYIVGRSLPGGRFEKVSVVETFHEELKCFTEKRRYTLI